MDAYFVGTRESMRRKEDHGMAPRGILGSNAALEQNTDLGGRRSPGGITATRGLEMIGSLSCSECEGSDVS